MGRELVTLELSTRGVFIMEADHLKMIRKNHFLVQLQVQHKFKRF